MRAVSIVLLLLVALVAVQAQAPIPRRPDGFQIGGPVTAPIVMDAFFDLLCPDCAAAWPQVKQVIDYYGVNISVAMHTFPLPYHTYAFVAAQAAHVVLSSKPRGGRAFADFMFANQGTFGNDATIAQSTSDVVQSMTKLVVSAGFSTIDAFSAGMQDPNMNEAARVSWKFACSKSVLGTPTFFINGVTVAADASWTLADWRFVLDPLLAPASSFAAAAAPTKCVDRAMSTRMFVKATKVCPVTQPTCTYLPGQVECCTPGENCIPNVGCRC